MTYDIITKLGDLNLWKTNDSEAAEPWKIEVKKNQETHNQQFFMTSVWTVHCFGLTLSFLDFYLSVSHFVKLSESKVGYTYLISPPWNLCNHIRTHNIQELCTNFARFNSNSIICQQQTPGYSDWGTHELNLTVQSVRQSMAFCNRQNSQAYRKTKPHGCPCYSVLRRRHALPPPLSITERFYMYRVIIPFLTDVSTP